MDEWIRSLLQSGVTGSFFLAGCVYLLKELKRIYEARIDSLEKRAEAGQKDRHEIHQQLIEEQAHCQKRIDELWKTILDLKSDNVVKAAEVAAIAALKVHDKLNKDRKE